MKLNLILEFDFPDHKGWTIKLGLDPIGQLTYLSKDSSLVKKEGLKDGFTIVGYNLYSKEFTEAYDSADKAIKAFVSINMALPDEPITIEWDRVPDE